MALTEQRPADRPSAGRRVRPPRAVLPPGPRWPVLAQTVGFSPLRHRFLPAMHRRYGDVFSLRTLPGVTFVMVSRPDDVRAVFAGDPEVYRAGDGNALLGPIMGRHSVLLQDAEDHKRSRRLLMPAFSGRAIASYADLVADVAAAEVRTWPAGREVRALDRMNALTLEVILRVVFGVTDEARLDRLRPPVERIVGVSPAVLLGWGYARLHRLPTWRRAVRDQDALDVELFDLIAERRRSPDLADRTDVLSRLLREGTPEEGGLSDVELRDQLVTLLLAGHETTASSLAWALYELAADPGLQQRARRAADEGDDGYLEAVLKEAMRLHPVIPMAIRHLAEPVRIGGWDLPAGVSLATSVILSHARSESFPDPERFRPERFLDDEVAPHTWIPFGGGVRRCLGAGFALMEGTVVLREVLRTHDLALPRGPVERVRVRNITSVPGGGARLVVRRRT